MSHVNEEIRYFEPASKLPVALEPTSLQVVKFAHRFVTRTEPKTFDWAGFKRAIDSFRGEDLAFETVNHSTIAETDVSVKAMVDRLVKFLTGTLSVTVPSELVAELTAVVEKTFTNLHFAKTNGWADFTSTSVATSSWEYRVIFAFPIPDDLENFYSLVTTIKLAANIEEETSWFGLFNHTTKNFSAVVDSMQLIVKKGFTAPI